MTSKPLRVALFSGNYNYVRDGANQALNRLVGYLLRQGVDVRVYAPVVKQPAFEATGTLIGVPSIAIPGRGEYRITTGLSNEVRRDLEAFDPDVVHISSPDPAAHRAVSWAKERNLPVVSSIHTRFETYLTYYNLSLFVPLLMAILRRLYKRCDVLLAPVESTATVLREQGMGDHIELWSRGVDRNQFNPDRRNMAWRRQHGIEDNEIAVTFLGRLVLEKGLDVFVDVMKRLQKMDVKFRPLIIGDGPAREWFEEHLPEGVFVGFKEGDELGEALACGDVFFNPSVTETFGNVTQEALSCGLPVVAASTTGASNLVEHGISGMLVEPGDIDAYAQALAIYIQTPELCREHGQAGVAFTQNRDWDSINNAVLQTYEKLVSGRLQKVKAA